MSIRRSTMRGRAHAFAAFVLAGALTLQASAASAEVFNVTSPAFMDGDLWPAKYARPNTGSPSPCPGENISPPVSWSNAPANTKTLALIMYDVDGGNGLGSVHWVAYEIPPTRTAFAEGEAMAAPKDFVGGKNNGGTTFYNGPCGPPGHAPHHYTITIIATDIAPGSLKPGLTRDELQTALKGHALDSATIVGRYGRP